MKFRMKTATALLAAWVFMLSGCANATNGPAGSPQLFTLEDTKGQSVSLGELLKTHKAVLVNFWATWCPPCREEIPNLIELQAKYKDKGLEILGVDVGESPAKVSNFMERAGINYTVVLDKNMAVSESYRVVGIPTTYLFSPEGKIIGEYHGFTPDLVSDVENTLK